MQGRAKKRILQGYASAFHFGVVLAISQLTMAAPREGCEKEAEGPL